MTFHVVYYSYEEKKVSRGYIGKHSSNDPYDDYLGSYKDKTFEPTQKIVLEYAKTEEGAILAEIRWQKVFQVRDNPEFANQSYQTSTGFKPVPMTPETRLKLSESLLGESNPMYGRVGELNPFFGKTHSPETIELLKKLAQENAKDPEWLKKTSKRGKKEKESTRQKKRDVVRGSWWSSSTGELK